MGNAVLGEPLPLPQLRGRDGGRCRRERMGNPHALGHPGCDADRPIGAGRDDAIDLPRTSEPVDALLVLRGENRTLVRKGEPGCTWVAVDCDDGEVVPPPCGLEEAELRRPRAEHEEATNGRHSGGGDRHRRLGEDATPPGLVLSVPGDGPLEPFVEANR